MLDANLNILIADDAEAAVNCCNTPQVPPIRKPGSVKGTTVQGCGTTDADKHEIY